MKTIYLTRPHWRFGLYPVSEKHKKDTFRPFGRDFKLFSGLHQVPLSLKSSSNSYQ